MSDVIKYCLGIVLLQSATMINTHVQSQTINKIYEDYQVNSGEYHTIYLNTNISTEDLIKDIITDGNLDIIDKGETIQQKGNYSLSYKSLSEKEYFFVVNRILFEGESPQEFGIILNTQNRNSILFQLHKKEGYPGYRFSNKKLKVRYYRDFNLETSIILNKKQAVSIAKFDQKQGENQKVQVLPPDFIDIDTSKVYSATYLFNLFKNLNNKKCLDCSWEYLDNETPMSEFYSSSGISKYEYRFIKEDE